MSFWAAYWELHNRLVSLSNRPSEKKSKKYQRLQGFMGIYGLNCIYFWNMISHRTEEKLQLNIIQQFSALEEPNEQKTVEIEKKFTEKTCYTEWKKFQKVVEDLTACRIPPRILLLRWAFRTEKEEKPPFHTSCFDDPSFLPKHPLWIQLPSMSYTYIYMHT